MWEGYITATGPEVPIALQTTQKRKKGKGPFPQGFYGNHKGAAYAGHRRHVARAPRFIHAVNLPFFNTPLFN